MAKKKPPLNVQAALKRIDKLITDFEKAIPSHAHPARNLAPGKTYELYVLSRTISELKGRGWDVYFRGTQIELKASPGYIRSTDPHFELNHQGSRLVEFEIYTDIEVKTLGGEHVTVSDLSGYHEIDIVVVYAGTTDRPEPAKLALGIECKATAIFSKSFVREVLGRRRELSYLFDVQSPPLDINGSVDLRAFPPSEYWLAFIDPSGNNYLQSPKVFGVELKHWKP